jgi:ferritin
MIGIGEDFDPISAQVMAVNSLKQVNYPLNDNQECFKAALEIEKEILGEIERLCKSGQYSQGTIQMLGDIADKTEVNVYKLKQRLKG